METFLNRSRPAPSLSPGFEFNPSVRVQESNIAFEDAARIAREQTARITFRPLASVRLTATGDWVESEGGRGGVNFVGRFSSAGFGRFCSSLHIPPVFLREMASFCPSLAADTINTFAKRRDTDLRLAFDGETVEGVVSPRFHRLNNSEVLESVQRETRAETVARFSLEGLRMRANIFDGADGRDMGDLVRDLGSCGLIRKNDVVHTGLEVYHAEDGGTSLQVNAFLWRVLCLNGSVYATDGSKARVAHTTWDILERMGDMVRHAGELNKSRIDLVAKAIGTAPDTRGVKKIMENAAKHLGKGFAKRLMTNAMREAEIEGHPDRMSLYNIWNAATVQAHDARDLTHARDIEVYSMQMLHAGMRAAA